jgi:hypothetical protein
MREVSMSWISTFRPMTFLFPFRRTDPRSYVRLRSHRLRADPDALDPADPVPGISRTGALNNWAENAIRPVALGRKRIHITQAPAAALLQSVCFAPSLLLPFAH